MASTNQACPILPEFQNFDPSNSLICLLVPSTEHHFHQKSFQTNIIMYRALAKEITNAILRLATPLDYKTLQHIITEDDGWKILEPLL